MRKLSCGIRPATQGNQSESENTQRERVQTKFSAASIALKGSALTKFARVQCTPRPTQRVDVQHAVAALLLSSAWTTRERRIDCDAISLVFDAISDPMAGLYPTATAANLADVTLMLMSIIPSCGAMYALFAPPDHLHYRPCSLATREHHYLKSQFLFLRRAWGPSPRSSQRTMTNGPSSSPIAC